MAADLVFAPPSDSDIAELAARMRLHDRREVEAARGADLLGAVRQSVALSANPIAVRSAQGLFAIFGTVPLSLLSDTGIVWMLGTDMLSGRPRTLSRAARRYIDDMRGSYRLLTNHVDARNAPAIRLLEWLGFTVGEPAPFGIAGLPFRRFELRSV